MKLENISVAPMPGDKLTRMSVLLAPAESPDIAISKTSKAFANHHGKQYKIHVDSWMVKSRLRGTNHIYSLQDASSVSWVDCDICSSLVQSPDNSSMSTGTVFDASPN
jgi:hypothetical protein